MLKHPTSSFVALAAKGLDSMPMDETRGPVNAPFFCGLGPVETCWTCWTCLLDLPSLL